MTRTITFQGSGATYNVPWHLSGGGEAVDAAVPLVNLKIATGGDDLREGSVARAFITLRDGTRGPVVDLNQGARWIDRSEHSVTVTAPPGARISNLESLTITFESGSCPFCSGDNWDVDAVTVTTGAGVLKVVRSRPLVRFSGEQRSFTFLLH
jgi:hypothetical protein